MPQHYPILQNPTSQKISLKYTPRCQYITIINNDDDACNYNSNNDNI